MEAVHNKLRQSFSFANGENKEIRIVMLPAEENKRKLYEASKIGSIQSLETLIQEDPHIIQKVLISSSSNTESPLHVSVLHGQLEFTRFLLDLKPELAGEVDALQRTPLHLASANGEVEIVQALLEKNTSACLVRDLNGLIPLHHAVISGQIEIMQELIHARPQSVWTKLHNGQTVLHLCAKDNHLEAIEMLIKTLKIHNDEEFLNTVDNSDNTVLDLSLMLRQIEIVRYLLSIPGIKVGTSMMSSCVASNGNGSSCQSLSCRIDQDVSRVREQCIEASSTCATSKKLMKSSWKKHLKYKGDWLQDVQGTMMLVATVIATVAFQGAINPPGGVWQEDIHFNPNTTAHRSYYRHDNLIAFIAGTAVMAYPTSNQGYGYITYLIMNSISFLASICVIIFIIARLPLRNRICAWLLTVTMCIAIASLAYSYLLGVWIVNVSFRNSYALKITYKVVFILLLVMVGVVVLCCIIIPLLIRVVKLLIWVVSTTT